MTSRRGAATAGLLAVLMACSPSTGGPLVLVGATLIDGTGGPPLRDAILVLEGDRILAAGHQSRVPLPKGARIQDLRGKFIVPWTPGREPQAAMLDLAERVRSGTPPLAALAEISSAPLEPGRRADLAILSGDPLLTPQNLSSVVSVMAGGRVVAPGAPAPRLPGRNSEAR